MGGLDEGLGWLGRIRGLLADHGNAALLIRSDSNSLNQTVLVTVGYYFDLVAVRIEISRRTLLFDETGMLN